jgi:hypothetical protein
MPAAMDESSPYPTTAPSPPPVPLPPLPAPAAVKVFGILHLVLAGLGILSGFWGFFSMKFTAMMQKMTPTDPTAVMQMKYMEDLWPVTVMSSTFALGLAALLLVSGLKLVREQADGIPWSNRYAWTSIVTKVIALVVAVAYVLPLTHRMMGEIVGNTPDLPPGLAGTMTGFMKSMSAIGTVLGPVLSCLYPALALYFLNRPAVKAWADRVR